jgi:hypothetical protein
MPACAGMTRWGGGGGGGVADDAAGADDEGGARRIWNADLFTAGQAWMAGSSPAITVWDMVFQTRSHLTKVFCFRCPRRAFFKQEALA